ncbi:MAG: hypothetical protein ACO1SV_07540 [Fimbriimonas sp.]
MTPRRDSDPLGLNAAQGKLAPQDYVVRERDAEGGSVPRASSFHDGIPRAVPFDRTWFYHAFQAMIERNPFGAAAFARFHDDVLNAAVETAGATAAEEWEAVRTENTIAREKAASVDAELAKEREALATLAEAQASTLASLDTASAEAASTAADAVSAAGGVLRPDKLDEDPFYRPRARSEAAVAADLHLPWPPVPKGAIMHPLVYWTLAAIGGAGMGLSFGAMAGAVHLDALPNESPWVIAYVSVLGFAMSSMMGAAVYLASRWASAGCFNGWKRGSWVPAAAVAVLSLALAATVFAVVDQQGLMKLAGLEDAAAGLGGEGGGSGRSPWAMLVGSFALALPSLFVQAGIGAWKGRSEAANRVAAEMAREKRDAEAELRDRPETKAALAALARARVRLWERNRAAETFATRRKEIETRIAELEKSRPAERHRLDGEGAKRVQDALDQALGMYRKQEAMIAEIGGGQAPARQVHAPKRRGKGLWERARAFIGRLRKGGG